MGMRKGKRRVVEVAVGRLGGPRALGRFPATHVEEWVPAIVGEDGLGRRRRRRARSIERGREGWAFVGSNPGSTTQTTSRTVHTNGLDEAERARAATAWTRSGRRIRWKWDPPRRRTKRSPWCSLSSPARPGLVGAEPPSRSVLSEGRCERSCRHVAHHPRSSCRPRGSRRPGRRTMCVEASLPIGSTPILRRGKRHVSGCERIPTVETLPFEPLNGRSGGTGVWASVSNAPLFLVQTPRFEGNPGPLRALNRAIDDRRWKRRPPAMALPRLESGRKRLEMDGGKTDREA